jgi:hypothetical protein
MMDGGSMLLALAPVEAVVFFVADAWAAGDVIGESHCLAEQPQRARTARATAGNSKSIKGTSFF